MTDKLRKYVLPNIPYVFIGWVFLKLGTAYRLAAGAGFGEKLLGLGRAVGAAFADFAPGLAPFDWLVGIVGAVAFRLLICFKSKNAKKFRRDEEYGSARWGSEKDIRPFVDPKFENNMLLTATERLTGEEGTQIRKIQEQAMKRKKILEAEGKRASLLREEPFFYARDSVEYKVHLMIWGTRGKERVVEVETFKISRTQRQ